MSSNLPWAPPRREPSAPLPPANPPNLDCIPPSTSAAPPGNPPVTAPNNAPLTLPPDRAVFIKLPPIPGTDAPIRSLTELTIDEFKLDLSALPRLNAILES